MHLWVSGVHAVDEGRRVIVDIVALILQRPSSLLALPFQSLYLLADLATSV